MRHLRLAAFLWFTLACVPFVYAGGLSVKPLKLFFATGSRAETLSVTNSEDRPLSVQLEAKAWSQDESGADVYADTTDIVLFPKILTIEPNASRTVRVGYQGEPATDREKSYRLYVQELPVEEPGDVAMRFVIRMGLPIFVPPAKNEDEWELDVPAIAGDGVRASVVNKGSHHLVPDELTLAGHGTESETLFTSDGQKWYVLAGARREFVLPLSEAQCRDAASLDVSAVVDGEVRSQPVAFSPADCQDLDDTKAARR